MRASSVLGCSFVLAGAVFGCSSSSGSGGAGGAATTAASTTVTSTHVTTSATHAASTTGVGVAVGGAGGAGGDMSIPCNPVNDTQCDIPSGDDCDYGLGPGFVCYLGPSTLALCAACIVNDANPPYCKDGTTCAPIDVNGNNGMCTKFCCSDADCGGATGSCTHALFGLLGGDQAIGLCGVPDASNTFLTPGCAPTVPATSPSNGTCYMPPNN